MRMFRLYGEGTRHLTRGAAVVRRIYNRWMKVDCSTEDELVAKLRQEKVLSFRRARLAGNSVKVSLAIVDVPRSTLYRWMKSYDRHGLAGLVNESQARRTPQPRRVRVQDVVDRVRLIREVSPWGKALLTEVLRRDGIDIGVASVGRIVGELLCKGRIVSGYSGQWGCPVRQRWRREWARRQRGKPVVEVPGRLQLDHMKVSRNQRRVVVFTARDVYSNAGWAMAASDATAASAARFLDFLREKAPFPLTHLQVDGGSEFKAVFEQNCRDLNLPLSVIPPRSPKHNSKIENLNGTLRREVFNWCNDCDFSVRDTQEALDYWMERYNHVRPNMALSYRDDRNRLRYHTPMEYIKAFIKSRKPPPSEIPICGTRAIPRACRYNEDMPSKIIHLPAAPLSATTSDC